MTETNYYYDEKNIIEEISLENVTICVVKGNKNDENDNVYCFDSNMKVIWRIKQAPVNIGGTMKSSYVGIDYTDGKCRVIDFWGRRFWVNINTGEIYGRDIVK